MSALHAQYGDEIFSDDQLEAGSDLKCGDVIKLERIGCKTVRIIPLSFDELREFPGRRYQVERISTPERIVLSALDEDLMYDP